MAWQRCSSWNLFKQDVYKRQVIDVVIHPAIDTASLDRHQIANITHEVDNTIRTTLTQLIEKREAAAKEKE